MPDERSAGAVVYRREDGRRRYLLLKYRSGHWGFVKGHVEEGESIGETIRREAQEETGLEDLAFHDDFEDHVVYHFQRGGQTIRKRVDFWLAETQTEDVAIGSPQEHVDITWVSYDEAKDRIRFDDMEALLRSAHQHLEKNPSRLNHF